MKKMHWLVLPLLLSACGSGSGIEGTYKSDKTMESITFHSNGMVTEMNAGVVIGEFQYKLMGNQLQIEGSDKPFIVNADGSIDGGRMHGTFTKK
jgi:hypothetical protein